MTVAAALDLIARAVTLTLLVSAPLLATTLLVGVLVTLFQAVTQIQEQTLTFVPKLIAVAAVLLLTLPWMLRHLVEFLSMNLRALPGLVG